VLAGFVGIAFHELAFLKREQPLGQVLTLGRQRLNLPSNRGEFADDTLKELGATSVDALDYSDFEGATYTGDLNRPIDLGRQFDAVVDFGTTEHVYSPASSLENCIRFCRVGGKILHALPANGDCGHGFYQLSPELFLALYSDRNGFAETEVFLADLMNQKFWWRVAPKGPSRRMMSNSISTAYVLARTTKTAEVDKLEVVQDFYEQAWDADERLTVGGKYARIADFLRRTPFAAAVTALYRSTIAPSALTGFNPNLEKYRIDLLPPRATTIRR
jgi:SAM-dependent methyltransferase